MSGYIRDIEGVNTAALTVGDEIYVSTTAGEYTTTRPTATNAQVQKIGLILRSHASLGIIDVIGSGRANDIPNDIGADDIGNKDVDDTELSYVNGVTSAQAGVCDSGQSTHRHCLAELPHPVIAEGTRNS